MFTSSHETDASDILKGLAAGLVGGLAGTWVMTQLQPKLKNAAEQALESDDDGGVEEGEQGQSEPATAQAATLIARRVGTDLDEQQKQQASLAVHYGFGTTMGALYGGVAEVAPTITAGYGLPAGLALFLAADETAVPAAGFSGPPTQMPASTHAYGLASHLVYGVVTEIVRRVVRSLL